MFTYNGKQFEFDWMGLFTTSEQWIHPNKCESTYEIIYVVKGEVNMFEENEKISLAPGELKIFFPAKEHGGTFPGKGETSFYWLHFRAEDPVEIPCKKIRFEQGHLFKELMHCRNTPYYSEDLVNAAFLRLLFCIKNSDVQNSDGNFRADGCGNSLSEDICEWIRINADARLTVGKTALHFGYNSEYLSRVVRKKCGITLKKLIDRSLIFKINDYLCNSHLYIKEIADTLNFGDSTAFINFYKYHQGMTPTEYRNKYSMTHMNRE